MVGVRTSSHTMTMLRTMAISSFLFMGVVSVAQADVFRWVDEHGGIHYSDQWVPGSQVIKSSAPRPPGSNPPVTSNSAQHTSDAQRSAGASGQSDASAAKAVKQDMAKIREQQCKDAKDKYDKAIEARRIYKGKPNDQSKEGDRPDDRQYLSDSEADAYRVKIRQEMQDLCGTPAK
jgi:hypothetical protein